MMILMNVTSSNEEQPVQVSVMIGRERGGRNRSAGPRGGTEGGRDRNPRGLPCHIPATTPDLWALSEIVEP